ncbi:UPF0755 protein [Silvibacterium bohemicum]|uniref:Endolytic murein transglycosylase n=1 Tax=Silvibacterium bohemicum TaxID=1577686 RepID=A0A841K3J0_9BACT|nr:endolytic transglycosylase MltG [Silvibacterium bohemicum]MBB6145731.1 UPF0755 protein [Silvibacterium bohemicum]
MKRLFFLLVLAAAAWAVFSIQVPTGPESESFLEIAPGTPSMKIAALLKQQGLIRSQYLFEVTHLVKGGTLKAGEYRFDHPAKIAEVYDRLRRGDVYTISLTIPEGSNLFDISERVAAAHFTSKEQFLATARADVKLIADLDPAATSLEGYLFPNTYRFGRKTTAEQILTAMVKQFRQSAAGLGLHANYRRVVTMASLIERETPIDAERPLVASVFENRLAKDMPLMTDPSVIYAALLDGRYRGTIYASDLEASSPYNTYRHAGLPPGPICNPGKASLQAAMNPAQTGYFYFVAASANPSGVSKFSATLAEHDRNVQDYRKAQREAGTR